MHLGDRLRSMAENAYTGNWASELKPMNKSARPKTVHLVAGARPNFMKVAPLFHALSRQSWCWPVLVHTGQHFDFNMSDSFWRDLGLPEPHQALNAGRGSHAEQMASVMIAYERVCLTDCPDWTVVVGDVNSTLACALTAKKLGIAVAHLEAGLRSGDRTMPEEINRICTDAISDLLWTPSSDADENLKHEGIATSRIERVGNIMIDSLERLAPAIKTDGVIKELGLQDCSYGLITLHRPSNVDDAHELKKIVRALIDCSRQIKLVFPVHPRTQKRLEDYKLEKEVENASEILQIPPLGYVSFMALMRRATLVITDSGGVQEETSYLKIPCITLRKNTERPITLTLGTNRLARATELVHHVRGIINGNWPKGGPIELWDGHTADRAGESLRRASNQE